MANVAVMLRIRTADRKQPYCPVVWADQKQKKLKPGWALVGGQPEHRAEGVYHIRYDKAGKRVWERVGKNADEALRRRNTVAFVLDQPDYQGIIRPDLQQRAESNVSPTPLKPTLATLRASFLADKRLTRKRDGSPLDKETLDAYEQQTEEFLRVIRRKYRLQVELRAGGRQRRGGGGQDGAQHEMGLGRRFGAAYREQPHRRVPQNSRM